MIRGGIAGKLGNRYEAKWLVRCFMEVIAGKAKWLKFEGLEKEYRGFEFAINRDGKTEWHQTKITAPTGNWTLNALKKKGLLRAFFDRLEASKNNECYLVSQDNAKILKTISKKARLANSFKEYLNNLSQDEHDEYIKHLKPEWNVDDTKARELLSRIYPRFVPEDELDNLILSFGGLYFHGSSRHVFPVLRDILEQNFNRKLDVQISRKLVRQEVDLEFKEWSFDPSIKQQLIRKRMHIWILIPHLG